MNANKNTLQATNFGTIDSSAYRRIEEQVPPELRDETRAHLANLAMIGEKSLTDFLPGHGVVPEDEQGTTDTFRRFGESADFVMQHAQSSADRVGAALAAVELHDAALYSDGPFGQHHAATEGLKSAFGMSGTSQEVQPGAQETSFAQQIVDRYNLDPAAGGTELAAQIEAQARTFRNEQ